MNVHNFHDHSRVKTDNDYGLLLNEIQLLLSEKRTSLSVMRTGIAVFVVPMTVFSVLIATSKYYDATKVLPLFVMIMAMNAALVMLAIYLVVRSLIKLHSLDILINKLKHKSKTIAELVA
jgi:uncharacterized membrane protein YidH (DUF202 family)